MESVPSIRQKSSTLVDMCVIFCADIWSNLRGRHDQDLQPERRGFIRLNALRLDVMAKVRRKKQTAPLSCIGKITAMENVAQCLPTGANNEHRI